MALAPAPDTIKALRLETSKIPVNLCHWAKFFGYAPTAYLFVREGYIPFRPPNQLQPSGEVFWPVNENLRASKAKPGRRNAVKRPEGRVAMAACSRQRQMPADSTTA